MEARVELSKHVQIVSYTLLVGCVGISAFAAEGAS